MSITIFAADDGVGGTELWRTDGTTGRTSLVKDINPGATGSNASNLDIFSRPILPFAVLSGFAYFSANDGVHGTELWRTDGTTAGTVEITDRPSGGYNPFNILVANNLLFFQSNGPSGLGIYSSTGVVGSTPALVATTTGLHGMIVGGNRLYWTQNGAGAANGLYTSDGVGAVQKLTSDNSHTTLLDAGGMLYDFTGTTLNRVVGTTVTAITNFPGHAVNMTNVGGVVYFTNANPSTDLYDTLYAIAPGDTAITTLKAGGLSMDAFDGRSAALGNKLVFLSTSGFETGPAHVELWSSDDTAAGTVKVTDLYPVQAYELTLMNGVLFFAGLDDHGNTTLWKTDGTAAGTVLIKQIEPFNPGGTSGGFAAQLYDMTAQDGLLYFSASDGADGRELWRSDGTADGTYQVRAINDTTKSGVDNLSHNYNPLPGSFGGLTYFTGVDPAHGAELWVTDGTAAGTHLFKDIDPGFRNSVPTVMGVSGSQLFVVADDGVHGSELWVSDGTAAGTHMTRDLVPGSGSGVSTFMAPGTPVFADSIIFGVGDDLWISSGTAAGTRLFSEAFPGADGSYAVSGNRLFYTTHPDNNGEHLWVSDGTLGGTREVATISGSGNNINLFTVTTLGSTLFFVADDGVHGQELWKSDGTAAGTVLVKDIVAGATGAQPSRLSPANGKLFFAITTNGSDRQIWTTDGTAANTVEVPHPAWTFSPLLDVAVGNTAYFRASEVGGFDFKLYATTGGMPVLLDGGNTNSPSNVMALNGGVAFLDSDATHGSELWFSAGTAATTGMVMDINPSGSSQITNMTLAGNHLFFTASDGAHLGLWVSDGTAAGTHVLTTGVLPSNLHAAGNSVIFTGLGAGNFVQSWISDGTTGGTFVINANTVPADSTPSPFTSLPGNLDTGPETLNGTAIADHLDGGAGNDTLNGLAGDDVLTGGAGSDTIDGGDGNDIATFTGNLFNQPNPDETFTYDPGTTAIVVTDHRGGAPDGVDNLINVETLKFADGYVVFDNANAHPWLINTVALDTQGSVVRSTFGLDNGGSWSNFVDTGNAAGVLWTSTHFDANGSAIEATTTNDDGTHTLTLFDPDSLYSFASVTIGYDANWNQTGVTELNDDSSTTVRPGQIGMAMDTVLWFTTPYDPDGGAAASNTLSGGANSDVLYGFADGDTLSGGSGNDIINGGSGDDMLSGGGGDDRFLFTYGDGNDIVTDFVAGNGSNDTIALHDYGVLNFASLQIAQVGNDAVITFDVYNHIVLQNAWMGDLNAGDFAFV